MATNHAATSEIDRRAVDIVSLLREGDSRSVRDCDVDTSMPSVPVCSAIARLSGPGQRKGKRAKCSQSTLYIRRLGTFVFSTQFDFLQCKGKS